MEKIFNEDGFLVVRESQCCVHYEPDVGALVPMKECWCCKWSFFKEEETELISESVGVCCYKGNKAATEACR